MEIKIMSYYEYYHNSKNGYGFSAIKRILNAKTLEELNKAIEWANNQDCLVIFEKVKPVKKEYDLEYQKQEKSHEIGKRMYWQYVIRNAMATSNKGLKIISMKTISSEKIEKTEI